MQFTCSVLCVLSQFSLCQALALPRLLGVCLLLQTSSWGWWVSSALAADIHQLENKIQISIEHFDGEDVSIIIYYYFYYYYYSCYYYYYYSGRKRSLWCPKIMVRVRKTNKKNLYNFFTSYFMILSRSASIWYSESNKNMTYPRQVGKLLAKARSFV